MLFNTHSHRSSASPHRVSADGGPQQEAAQAVLELVTLLSSQVHIRRLADCLTAFPSAGTNLNISPFSLPLNLIETVETSLDIAVLLYSIKSYSFWASVLGLCGKVLVAGGPHGILQTQSKQHITLTSLH